MLVNIGHRPAPTDLVSALLECHERIRTFGALAVAVGDRPDLPPDQADAACLRVARYFSESLPMHVQDEERSILPRLAGRSAALDEALAEMQAQHRTHEAPLRQLIELCPRMCTAPDATVRADFCGVAHHLDQDFRRHLDFEEASLFPAVRAQMSPDEQVAILAEMRARRQIASHRPGSL
jgi:hemerythrin-like domain-containing protein